MSHINCSLYHYEGNNPVKYLDPDGRADKVSGGLPYEPEKWNETYFPGAMQYRTNCYAYALNLQHNPITGERFYYRCKN